MEKRDRDGQCSITGTVSWCLVMLGSWQLVCLRVIQNQDSDSDIQMYSPFVLQT